MHAEIKIFITKKQKMYDLVLNSPMNLESASFIIILSIFKVF